MKNGMVILAVTLSLASFGGMMRIKTDVQQMTRERLRLAAEQLELKETKRVLEAEYAMLSSPLRLAQMARMRGFTELKMTAVVPMMPPARPLSESFVVKGGVVQVREDVTPTVGTAPPVMVTATVGPAVPVSISVTGTGNGDLSHFMDEMNR